MREVPFSPQPEKKLRSRFNEAISPTVDIESVNIGVAAPPGSMPRCIFDWKDGLRMLIYRSSDLHLVVGAKIRADGKFSKSIKCSCCDLPKMNIAKSIIMNRFRRLSQYDGPMNDCNVSDNCFVHISRGPVSDERIGNRRQDHQKG